MAKVTNFTRDNLRNIQTAINAALKEVGDQYGISLKAGGGSFTDSSFTTKVTGAVVATNGVVKTPGRSALEAFHPKLVDKVITAGGVRVKLVEYKPRRYKFPFVGQAANGARYKITEAQASR